MPPAGTVACPYCNAFVPVPPNTVAGRRLACPRCSEAFAYLPRDGETAATSTNGFTEPTPKTPPSDETSDSRPPDTDSFRAKVLLLFRALLVMAGILVFVGATYVNSLVSNGLPFDIHTFGEVAVPLAILWIAVGGTAFLWVWFFRVRRSNGATALFVVGNMLALALLTLGGALATTGYRRHLDAGLPGRPKRSPIIEEIVRSAPPAVAPAHLAALGYLPPKIDLLAGVHVAELMESPSDRKLLEEPLKFGNMDVRLADLTVKVGLQAQDLDHFVVGMRTNELLSPVFVFRTRQQYDSEKLRHALKAKVEPGKAGGKTLYRVSFPTENLSSLLWCADEHTFLISLARESLEQAAVPGESGPDPLVPEVRGLLTERMRPVAQLWIAGYSADWGKTAVGLALGRLPEAWQKQLSAVRAFGVWVVTGDKSVTLNAAARCDDEKSAERLAKWSASRKTEKNPATIVHDDKWLSVQMRSDIDSIRELLAP
jgi:hypothetical protein